MISFPLGDGDCIQATPALSGERDSTRNAPRVNRLRKATASRLHRFSDRSRNVLGMFPTKWAMESATFLHCGTGRRDAGFKPSGATGTSSKQEIPGEGLACRLCAGVDVDEPKLTRERRRDGWLVCLGFKCSPRTSRNPA